MLHPVGWNYRSNQQCEKEIDAQVRYLVALTGCDAHLLSMPMPYPVSAWARNYDLNTPNPVDQKAWDKHLNTKQRSLRYGNLGENITMVGVTLGARNPINTMLDRFRPGAVREATRFADEIAVLTEALSHVAQPANQREVEWLLHQTRGCSLPTPPASPLHGKTPMGPYDLAGIYDNVEVVPGRIGARSTHLVGATRLVTTPDGETTTKEFERWVTVVAMGRTEPLTIPEKHSPWLAYAQQFPGVITSVRFTVVSGPDAAKAVEAKIKLVQEQAEQIAQHGMTPQPNLHRVLGRAIAMQDQMQESHSAHATRVKVWARFAISAPTEAETATKVQQFRKHMEKYNIATEPPKAQEALYRELTPGEPLATTAHRRVMPVRMFAAAVPQVSSAIGDRQGTHFGHTVGVVKAPCIWDMWLGMEQNDAGGFTPVVGEMGSGKSSFLGYCIAMAIFRGIFTTALDPSGLLAKVAQWGPIKDHTDVIDLLTSPPGSLSPFSVVPEPRIEHARQDPKTLELPEDEREEYAARLHADNVVDAAITRKALAVDVLRNCLPKGLNRDPNTEVLLMQAVRATHGLQTSSLTVALDALAAMKDKHAQVLHATLQEIREHPYARLFLGAGYQHTAFSKTDPTPSDKTGLIITMSGLVLPDPTSDRDTWSMAERLAVPLLNLAAHYTSSRIYRRPMNERKLFAGDEFHFFAAWPSGRALTSRLERDSRKWNLRVLAASQDTVTAMSSQDASSALVSDAIIFNISANSPEQQKAGLKILNIPSGFEKVLSDLRSRRDERNPNAPKWRDAMVRINGEPGRVRFTYGDEPDLQRLLITTPAPAKREGSTATTDEEWFAHA